MDLISAVLANWLLYVVSVVCVVGGIAFWSLTRMKFPGVTVSYDSPGQNILDEMRAGVLVLDSNGKCISRAGRIHELLDQNTDWEPVGLHITEIIRQLAVRGDYGPRIPGDQPISADLFNLSEFERFRS